jgi:integrase
MRQRITEGHLRLRGHNWYCQWKYKNKPFQVSLHTGNEREARTLFARQMTLVRAAIIDGTHAQKFGSDNEPAPASDAPNDIPISEAWSRYLRSVTKPDTGESTLLQYALQFGRLVTWVRRHRGPKTIRTFTKAVAREFAGDLAEKVGAATFNKYINLFRLVFRVLLDELDARDNPWAGIQRKKPNGEGRRSFTAQEVATIFTILNRMAAGEEVVKLDDGGEVVKRLDVNEIAFAKETRTLCLTAYHTGLRFGDCATLLWTEVDIGKSVVVRVPGKTKRRHPNRPVIIPLTTELREHLMNLPREDAAGFVCPLAAEQYLQHGRNGASDATEAFVRVLKQAGIRTHKVGTGKGTGKRAVVEVGFHSFRHTWVTTSEEVGIDQATVRAVVGWGSPAMERVYSHIGEDHLRAAMAKRSSLSVTNGAAATGNGNGGSQAAQQSSDPAADLNGMSKADLERLLAAVEKKIKDVDKAS